MRATSSVSNEDLSKVSLGFWLYLMTDCILFASLFATYAVLRNGVGEGPTASEIFDLPFVLTETIILLFSSFTAGIALLAAQKKLKSIAISMLCATFVLGAVFLGMELYEFNKIYDEGHSFATSGFLSAYFTLIGTHGLHIFAGLLWIMVLVPYIIKKGLSTIALKRLTIFTMFWHFLDLVWIFIFTVVYLIGDNVV